VENLAETFLSLSKSDLAILRGIERGMRHNEWVSLPDIIQITKRAPQAVDRQLKWLSGRGFAFKIWDPYEGYQIGFRAYDVLALTDLVDRNVVLCLGDLLGVGKESEVYQALGKEIIEGSAEELANELCSKDDVNTETKTKSGLFGDVKGDIEVEIEIPLAIKFHRQGQTSFKHVRRTRDHLDGLQQCSWIHAARLAAQKEYRVMKALYPEVSVPRPVAISRHAIVMDMLEQVELYKVNLDNPREVLNIILEEISLVWKKGFIHSDLSAYNVLVNEEGITIIDWPQAVSVNHPQAGFYIKRDVENLIKHFQRKYRLQVSSDDALHCITGSEKITNEAFCDEQTLHGIDFDPDIDCDVDYGVDAD